MIDYPFTYLDTNFALEQARGASLFIRAGKGRLSFLITDDDRVLAWKDQCGADELLAHSELMHILTAPYKKTLLGILPDALFVLPTVLFAPGDIATYARYLDVKPDDRVFVAALDDENQLLYKADNVVLKPLSADFNLQAAVPADKGWINAISTTNPADNHLYLNISGQQAAFLNFRHSKLYLYNCFDAAGIDDVLYYCLFIAAQLQLETDEVRLVVSGDIKYGDESFNKLTEFFKQVTLNDIKLVQVPSQIQPHQVLSLAALS